MASFREINYSLRPAKSVERKIMSDAFRRVETGWDLSTYRYVGMGSVYFADFQLFHQTLGINDMISIEREVDHKARFEFNRPYGCVEMQYGESSDVLGAISWDKRCIVWLDYDGKLEASVISDLKTVIQKAPSGSFVVVSVNVEADRPLHDITQQGIDAVNQWRIEQMEERISSSLPASIKGNNLRGKDFGLACWQILAAAVEDQIIKRNGRPDLRPETMFARQVFHFNYSDGAPMLTVGWLLHSHADAEKVQRCLMDGPYFSTGADPVIIEAPKLTPKEVNFLNSKLPDGPPVPRAVSKKIHKETGITESDINKFAAIYRFYPQYGEVVL
jgi:hypothetical protein